MRYAIALPLASLTLVLACSGASTVAIGRDDGGTSSGSSGGGSGGSSGGGSGGSSGGSSGSSSGGSSGSGSGGSSGSGSGSSSGGGMCSPTPPDGGACNSLQPAGPQIPLQCSPGAMPVPSGGTIVDGTYLLASETYYGSPCLSPEQDRNTWLVCGSTWQTVQENTPQAGSPALNTYNLNVTRNGTTLQLQGLCGFTQTATFQYDATPTTLTLYVGGGSTPGTGRVDLYNRQ